ncbi:rCG47724 [Rattus norvegicus]|uniref:RCG47724 n=1 Tax=Rattus norvegicus TaxID=10116 RepID=A6HY18_RAT|nr:rCG47724 [Rattus norvegicus]
MKSSRGMGSAVRDAQLKELSRSSSQVLSLRTAVLHCRKMDSFLTQLPRSPQMPASHRTQTIGLKQREGIYLEVTQAPPSLLAST